MKHTERFYARVDVLINFFLESPQWLQKKRSRELNLHVQEIFGVKSTQAAKYLREARQAYLRLTDNTFELKKRLVEMQLNSLIVRARKDGKMRIELQGIKELAVINGLHRERMDMPQENIVIEIDWGLDDDDDKSV